MYKTSRIWCIAKVSIALLIAWLGLSSTMMQSAWAVKADGGYEGLRLPGDEGWVEVGTSFMGDYVTIADGIMTYNGKANPPPGSCGMKPDRFPLSGRSATIEYRVRCRSVSGKKNSWWQSFLMTSFCNERYALYTSLGRFKGSSNQAHKIRSVAPPGEEGAIVGSVRPPTKMGTWNTNEWITVRHIIRDTGKAKYHVESWIRGPAGEKKYLDVTKDHHPGFSPNFTLLVQTDSSPGAVFDLDYIRWSDRVVPWDAPLSPANTAPAVLSIHPKGGATTGGTTVTISGGNFDAKTKVTFDGVPALSIKCMNPYRLTCVTPVRSGTGWVDAVVRNFGGSDTVRKGFFYGTLPKVKGVAPAEGTNLGGQRVTVSGTGFQSGMGLKFDQMSADDVKVVDSKTITCRTPGAFGRCRGLIDITVTNPDSGHTTRKDIYAYKRSSPVKPKVIGWHIDLHDFNLPIAIQKLEQMPFHGLILRPRNGRRIANGTFTEEDARYNTAILKAVDFQRFKHNFLHDSLTGHRGHQISPDFFEDWTDVIAGRRRYARMCKEIGFEGIWFDVENYGGKDCANLASSSYRDKGKSFTECKKQVKLRARQMMSAMLTECPDIKVMTSFGLGVGTGSGDLDLLPAFCDGLLEAVASDQAYARAQVIDGYEDGYYIATAKGYQRAYDRMRRPGGIAYQRSEQDQAWADHGAAAFGVYPDENKLDAFKTQIVSAMIHTDAYVWLFTNGTFFPGNNIPILKGKDAKETDRYIQCLAEATGLPRATPPGRYRAIGHWRMEEGRGTSTADLSGLGFNGTLSAAGLWTKDTPTLPKVPNNRSALDLRGGSQYVNIDGFGYYSRSPEGDNRDMTTSHLGNLYFTDHTLEFSFWWGGQKSAEPQYLYGADGGKDKTGHANTFAYCGRIPAGERKLIHWQRGDYGDEYGAIQIDLAKAQAVGAYRFGQWANVAIKIKTIDSRKWRIFLNGKDVTDKPWAGFYKGHETIGGYGFMDGKQGLCAFLIDLVLGARNSDELGITAPFNGMLDEFRITAGQVPAKDLLSAE